MLNTVCLQGRITRAPELRTTQSGKSVTSFTLAVMRDYTANGQKETDFIDVVAWGGTAEFVTKWFTKGLLVAVCGRLESRTWEDKQGQKRKSVEVVADRAYFCEKKNNGPAGVGVDFVESDDDGQLPF